MASTTMIRELFRRISVQLQDSDPQFGRYTQQAMVDATTDGQRVIAKYLPPSVARVDAIKLVAGPRQSIDVIAADRIRPGDGSAPALARGLMLLPGPVRNMGSDGATPGIVASQVDRPMLDATDPDWMSATGRVVRELVVERGMPRQFWVTPAPRAGESVWLELPWAIQPAALDGTKNYAASGTESALLSIDDVNVDDLFHYVVARLLMTEAEHAPAGNLAASYMQLFITAINRQATALGLPKMPREAVNTRQDQA